MSSEIGQGFQQLGLPTMWETSAGAGLESCLTGKFQAIWVNICLKTQIKGVTAFTTHFCFRMLIIKTNRLRQLLVA